MSDKVLIEITDCVLINSSDVSSLEYERYYGASYWGNTSGRAGTIITMKSGRKIFVGGSTPKEVNAKLNLETK